MPYNLVFVIQVASQQKSLIAQCRRVYANSHDYNIHSISNNRFCASLPYILLDKSLITLGINFHGLFCNRFFIYRDPFILSLEDLFSFRFVCTNSFAHYILKYLNIKDILYTALYLSKEREEKKIMYYVLIFLMFVSHVVVKKAM